MIALQDVKDAIRITHNEDDAMLTRLIGSAVRECLAYLNSEDLPGVADSDGNVGEVDIPEDVFNGIVLMVRADYEGDPKDRNLYRQSAQTLWHYYKRHAV